ncbi:exodeoxyribonuclease VII small subunit [Marinicellulosiphila megalodicopiae]|uniref:exodeoxyribonuclease VII small subunit n=1 Tax=Marinicellulosiphila megalodicopiae TaxID=2724896 RepID=UPI003BB0705E
MAKAQSNFEQSIVELEKLVDALEGDELSLDESLKVFEKGVKLSRSCQKILDQAELKIQKLSDEQWQDVSDEL